MTQTVKRILFVILGLVLVFLIGWGIIAGPIILLSALLAFLGISATVAISMLLWSMSETIYPKKE